ncbi:MAG: type II secretion system F family protein [Negativicutes bacterium]|nr:type II secretion system F family protein [Negativicutes bacterium]
MVSILLMMTLSSFVLFFLVLQYVARTRLAVNDQTAISSYAAERPGQAGRSAQLEHGRSYEERLRQAGIRMSVSRFLILALGSAMTAGLLLAMIVPASLRLAPVAGVLVLAVILLVVRIRVARRFNKFNSQLGEALMLLASALRSGLSFLQAAQMVAKEMRPPMSREFARMVQEVELGVATEEALENLARRVGSEDLRLIVTAVLIQRQVGGNLAQVFDIIAQTIQERLILRRELRMLTAQGRASGWIIALLPVFMVFVLSAISPGYFLSLVGDPLGLRLVIGGITSQLLGILIIRRIVDIDV